MWRSHPQKLDEEHDIGDPLGPPMLWPDGRHIAANGLGRIFLWDLETGECTQVLETEAICRDGDPSFKLGCDRDLGRILDGHKIRDFAIWDSVDWRRLQTFVGHSEEVQAAAFVAEDRVLSVSGDSTAQLWDAWTGESLRSIDTDPLYALAQHPERDLVAVAGGRGGIFLLEGRSLRVVASLHLTMAKAKHEPLSEERKRQIGIVWNRPSNTIQALAWHPDGEHLICGSWDFVPKLVHPRSGRVLRSWHGHAHWVDAVAVEPVRRLLCTGSSDGTVRVWSLDSTECLAVHTLGHANIGGLVVHKDFIYATCRRELVVIPLLAAP